MSSVPASCWSKLLVGLTETEIHPFLSIELISKEKHNTSVVKRCSVLNRDCICIHLKSDVEKFYLLCLMTRKLFTFAKQECMEENPDSITFQEVLTPGQLYLMFLKVTPARCSISNVFAALCQYMPETARYCYSGLKSESCCD